MPVDYTVTLREYLESRLDSIEKAVEVANYALQKRLEGMNEFRDTLKDQASRFITRDELEIKIKNLDGQVETLQRFQAQLEGKASQTQANIILIISVLSLGVSIISFIMKL